MVGEHLSGDRPQGQRQGCEIQWADETGLSNQANYGRSFAPRGQTPIIRRPAGRFSQSMISSLTNQGKLRFMIYEGALNTAIFLNFLRRWSARRDASCSSSSTICRYIERAGSPPGYRTMPIRSNSSICRPRPSPGQAHMGIFEVKRFRGPWEFSGGWFGSKV